MANMDERIKFFPAKDKDTTMREVALQVSPLVRLLRITGNPDTYGFRCVVQNEDQKKKENIALAAAFDLNPYYYGRKSGIWDGEELVVDTGLRLLQNEANLRLPNIEEQLAINGYAYNGGHYFWKKDKLSPVIVLEFRLGVPLEKRQELPIGIKKMLETQRFAQLNLWVNRRTAPAPDGREYRLDTINLNNPHFPSANKNEKGTRVLNITEDGKNYTLDPYTPPTAQASEAPKET